MDDVSKNERILNLMAVLLTTDRPMPIEEIKEKVLGYQEGTVEAVRKRFERDKRTLRDMGVGISQTRKLGGDPGGYRIDRSCLFLRPLELTPEESRMLAIISRHFPVSPGSALEANLRAALLKLQLAASPDLDELPPAMLAGSGQGSAVDPQIHDVLAQAVRDGHRVSFRYRTPGAARAGSRRVDPYGLGYFYGQWYLVGHCHKREAVRTFRLSRMDGVPKQGRAKFEIPEGFALEAYLDKHSWQIGPGGLSQARIAFDADTYWIASRQVSHDARREPSDDGSGELHVSYADPDRLIGWLQQFDGHARIEGPDDLVARRSAFLGEVARRHRRPAEPLGPPANGKRPKQVQPKVTAKQDEQNRLTRILTLIPFLTRHPEIHVDEVSSLCGIPAEQILADLHEVLMCGLPPYLPDDYIGVYIEEGYITLRWADHFSCPVQLNLTEALALRLATGRVLGDTENELAGRVRARIEEILPDGVAASLQQLAERIRVSAGGSPQVMTPLLEALANGLKVRADYFSVSTGKLTTRVLRPYQLTDHAGVFYLIAHCESREDVRSFHTGRFRKVLLTADSFEQPRQLPSTPLPGLPGAPVETATIRFDESAVAQILDSFDPDHVQLLKDGAAVVRLPLFSQRWILSWLLQFGARFEVMEPPALRKALAELS